MTAGEKINYYRKQLGLSQEELGQKLLISRQTISQWEKGQTVPTIDNLIRLKEIFGVSVDEILGCAQESEVTDDLPVAKEEYVFHYCKDELAKIIKLSNNTLKRRCLIVIAIAFIGMLVSYFGYEPMSAGSAALFGVAAVCGLISFKLMKENKKNWSTAAEKIEKSFYHLKVYADYFNITIVRNEEEVSKYKFYFTDIEKIEESDGYFFLVISGQIFILRKSDLIENSAFYSVIYNNPKKFIGPKVNNARSVVLTLLFVLSLFSFFLAMLIALWVPETSVETTMWPFFAVTPIPVASLIVGIIFKAKGYKCTKNIIAGVLVTIVLCLFGSTPYMEEDPAEQSDAEITKVESIIGIDIPESESTETYYWEEDDQYISRCRVKTSSTLFFSVEQAEKFENEIAKNPLWLTKMPNELWGLTSDIAAYLDTDYTLLYNVDTKQFNTVPSQNGTYDFFQICYYPETDSMEISEYELEYIK